MRQGFWLEIGGKWIHVQGDKDLTDEDLDMIRKLTNAAIQKFAPENIEIEEPEYIMECSMCGKETAHRACGMCPHCEMVWNG